MSSTYSLKVKNLPEIALSLTVFGINDIFHFRQNSRWQPKKKSENSKIFRGASGVVLCTFRVKNLPEIALSLTVFEINDISHSRQNSRLGLKFQKV